MNGDDRSTEADDAPLNPALKSGTDLTYDTDRTTPAPIETASARAGEGEGGPVIWLIVVVLGVALTIYLVL